LDTRRAAWLLAAGRAAIGAAVLAAPEAVMSRWLGPENAGRGASKTLGRGFAARDVGLAVASLQTLDDPVIGPRVMLACALADGVDGLATWLERDSLPPVAAAGTIAVAGGAAVAGLYLSHRLAHED
jgi:hypothetical protein